MMYNNMKVSVIVPVYNGANYVRKSIDSILSQTYPIYEIVVVDDGSTDNTYEILCSYNNIITVIKKNNGGCSSALNCAIKYATGDYIAWLSHDDLFLPKKIERQVDFLNQHADYTACYTDYFIIDEFDNIVKSVDAPWYSQRKAVEKLFGFNYINGSTMLIRRSCFEGIGFFSENLRYTNDLNLWLRMLQRYNIGHLPEKLGMLRVHPTQVGQNVKAANLELKSMYEAFLCDLVTNGFFESNGINANDSSSKIAAFIWFGDVMAKERSWNVYALDQYIKALKLSLKLNNPALLKIIKIMIKVVKIYIINWLKDASRPARNSVRNMITFQRDVK